MPLTEYPGFCGPSYQARSNIADCEHTINLYPEVITQGTGKSKVQLYGTPGASTFNNTLVASGYIPVAMRSFVMQPAAATAGPIIAIAAYSPTAGNLTTYIIQQDGSGLITSNYPIAVGATPNLPIGVFLESNGTYLVIAVNQSNGSGSRIYTWNLVTLTQAEATSWATAGLNSQTITGMCFLDGYFFVSTKQNVYASAINDPTSWNSLNFTFENDEPDLIVTCAAQQRQVWFFGNNRIEAYYDAGLSGFPLQRVPGGVIEQGIRFRRTLCFADNSFFWLGQDAHGAAVVYRNQGYSAQRVSNHAIEGQIQAQLATIGSDSDTAVGWGFDYMQPSAYMYQDAGHLYYVLNLSGFYSPSANWRTSGTIQPTTTWVYDVSNGMWHERRSPSLGSRHFANMYAYLPAAGGSSGGLHLVSDLSSNTIWQMSTSILTENGTAITRRRITPHLSEDGNYSFYHRFVLDCEVGTEASGSQSFTLQWSDDGGQTFNTGTTLTVGTSGNYLARAIWRRLGKSRDRVFMLTTSDVMQVALINAYLDLEPGY